jgi:hypothetical protein
MATEPAKKNGRLRLRDCRHVLLNVVWGWLLSELLLNPWTGWHLLQAILCSLGHARVVAWYLWLGCCVAIGVGFNTHDIQPDR